MRTVVKSIVIVVVIAGAMTSRAWACSVTSDYVRPTNFELVQLADAIVVATPLKESKGQTYGNEVTFRVDKVMKGPAPKSLLHQWAYLGEAFPSDPNDISGSHPEGHAGPCNRTMFAKGKQYVLFLSKDKKGTYMQLGHAFSRVNEDYLGEESLWVGVIRAYLEIQQKYAPMQQLDVLDAMLQEKLKGPRTQTTLAEAQDILDHLRSRSPWKPTAYLVQTYETLERGEQPKYGVRSRAADRENSAAQDLTDALFGQAPPPDKMSVEEEKNFVLRSLVLGDHAGAAPLFDRLMAAPRPPARHLGLAARFFAKNGAYRKAYAIIETRIVQVLAAIPRLETAHLISDVMDTQRGDSFGEGKERWRSDPYVAAAWPELALHLYWFQYYVLGGDRGDTEAIQTLAGADPRARPLVTLALAASFDDKLEKWAAAELMDDAKRVAWETKEESDKYDLEDPALLPMQVLVIAYGDARDAALKKVACQSKDRRELLVDTLGRWGDLLDREWLEKIAAMPEANEIDKMFVAQALARLFARQSRNGGLLGIAGDSEYQSMEKVIKGEKLDVEPLRCGK